MNQPQRRRGHRGRLLCALCVSAVVCGLCVLGCTQLHTFHAPDVDLPVPSAAQLQVLKSEAYRTDPCRVAHLEIQTYVNVPWTGEPYDASKYQFIERNPERAEWGSYVVRSYFDRSHRHIRYRVKVRQAEGIWYAIQVSRFIDAELMHPALEGH